MYTLFNMLITKREVHVVRRKKAAFKGLISILDISGQMVEYPTLKMRPMSQREDMKAFAKDAKALRGDFERAQRRLGF